MRKDFRKGVHCCCKYNGDNGDLIVGQVKSVRRNGECLITNLLTGSTSVKKMAVLKRRNLVITKKDAMAIVKEFRLYGRDVARTGAVQTAERYEVAPRRRHIRVERPRETIGTATVVPTSEAPLPVQIFAMFSSCTNEQKRKILLTLTRDLLEEMGEQEVGAQVAEVVSNGAQARVSS